MMERDFLGLGSKSPPTTVKEEASTDASMDSVAIRGSGMQQQQWPCSNKVSVIPQFLSFKPGLEDKTRKNVHDPGFMSISAANGVDSNQKTYPGLLKKSRSFDQEAGKHFPITNYGMQHLDSYPIYHPQEMRMFAASNQHNHTTNVSITNPVLQSHFTSTGLNLLGNPTHTAALGGVPVVNPVSVVPNTSSVVGSTDLRNASKSTCAPAQLTIFYAGAVCVFDDVTPEKAQAIMLLAGNGAPVSQNKTPCTSQLHTPIPRPTAPFYASSPCSSLASPISMTSTATSTKEIMTVMSMGALASSSNQNEPPKAVNSLGPVGRSGTPVPTVPQARKASLARFLEKRKERVTSAAPYNSGKKSSDDCSSTGSDCVVLSMNSSVLTSSATSALPADY